MILWAEIRTFSPRKGRKKKSGICLVLRGGSILQPLSEDRGREREAREKVKLDHFPSSAHSCTSKLSGSM